MRAGRAPTGAPSEPVDDGGDRVPPVRPGDRVGHYQVVAEIGHGGMGVIFRAHDPRLRRDVALKCPWPRMATDATVRERFLREARSASQLTHPHVLPIFQTFRWGGLPWIAMELVDGPNLRLFLESEGRVPIRRALAWAEGLSDALRAAHAKGIVHRDINPNNILIRGDWPLLTDFGLAHRLDVEAADSSATTASGPLTEPGHVVGTRGYMSPEQMLGRPVGPRSDIFSLGAVLYEMFTGTRAFPAARDAAEPVEPLAMSSIVPEIPADLDRVVRRALARHPDERQADARELHDEIADVRRRLESADYTPGPAPSAARPPSRPWVTTALAAAAAGAALVTVVARMIPALKPSKPAPQAFTIGTPHQITSDPGCETEPAISPGGDMIAYTVKSGDSSDIWVTDVKGASRLRLTDGGALNGSAAWFPDGGAIAFVSDRSGDLSIFKVARLGGPATLLVPRAVDPTVSPDGRRIAFSRPNAAGVNRLAVAPIDDTARAAGLTGDEDGERSHIEPAWSPDGRQIAYSDTRDLWIIDVDGGHARRLTSSNAGDNSPAWSSDGRSVVFKSEREGTRALWRVPVAGGPVQRLTSGSGPEVHPSIAADGSKLVYSTYSADYDVALVDLASGRREVIKSLLYDAFPSFAPDGRALVITSGRRGGRWDLWRQDLASGHVSGPPVPITDLPDGVNMPMYSPDGRWIAFKREMPHAREIWIVPSAGGIPERFSDGAGKDMLPAWSPDGAQLAYTSERGAEINLWVAPVRDGHRAGSSRQITFGKLGHWMPTWSPDGRQIAHIQNSDQGAEIRVVTPGTGSVSPPLARAVEIGRLRWDATTGWIWFTAAATRGAPRLLKVRDGGPAEAVEAVPGALFTEAAAPGDFDLSSDGRILAYTREDLRGDIWLLDSGRATY